MKKITTTRQLEEWLQKAKEKVWFAPQVICPNPDKSGDSRVYATVGHEGNFFVYQFVLPGKKVLDSDCPEYGWVLIFSRIVNTDSLAMPRFVRAHTSKDTRPPAGFDDDKRQVIMS